MKLVNLFIALLFILSGCASQPTTEQCVIVDTTDPTHVRSLNIDAIIDAFPLQVDIWCGARYSLATVTDVLYNERVSIGIDPASPWTNSKKTRKQEVQEFYTEVESSLLELKEDTLGRPASSIWMTISYELHRLSTSNSEERRLFVYSDLHEHTERFSLYRSKQLQLLEQKPDSVLSLLSQLQELPFNLDGIDVYLIWTPTAPESAERFHRMGMLYKSALEERGAKVHISGSLNLASANSSYEPKVLLAGVSSTGGEEEWAQLDNPLKDIINDDQTRKNLINALLILGAGLIILGFLMHFLDKLAMRFEKRILRLFKRAVRTVIRESFDEKKES